MIARQVDVFLSPTASQTTAEGATEGTAEGETAFQEAHRFQAHRRKGQEEGGMDKLKGSGVTLWII